MAYYNSFNSLPNISGQDRMGQGGRWGQPSYAPQRSYGADNTGIMPGRGYDNTGKLPAQPLPSNKPLGRRASITHEFKPNLLQQPQVSRTDNRGGPQNRGPPDRGPDRDINRPAGNHGGFYSRNLAMGYNESRTYNPPANPYGGMNPYNNPYNPTRYDEPGRDVPGDLSSLQREKNTLQHRMNTERTRMNPFSFSDVSAERRIQQKQFQQKPPTNSIQGIQQKQFQPTNSIQGLQQKQFQPTQQKQFQYNKQAPPMNSRTFESQQSPSSSMNSSSQNRWWDTRDTTKANSSPSPKPKPKETPNRSEVERKPIKENKFVAKKELSNTTIRNKPATENEKFVAKPKPDFKNPPLRNKPKEIETYAGKKEYKNTTIRNTPAKEIEKLVAKKEAKIPAPLNEPKKQNKTIPEAPPRIQEEHLPDHNDDYSNSDEMEKLAELERITLRKAVMKQKMIYEDVTDKDNNDKELEKQRKFQKSRQKLEEENAIMDAINEEASDENSFDHNDRLPSSTSGLNNEETGGTGSSHFSFSGSSGQDVEEDRDSALNEEDDVFVEDDDLSLPRGNTEDDEEEEWW